MDKPLTPEDLDRKLHRLTGRHNSHQPDPQAQANKAALAAQLDELLETPGWTFALAQAKNILHQNHKVLRQRTTDISETNAARGALDAIMTLLFVVYTAAGKGIPDDLKPFYD